MRTTPDELVLAPLWHGKQVPRGYVINLHFDPSVLQFRQYLGRDEESPLPWVVESKPGQLIIAAGLSNSQRAFSGSDLGHLAFVRLSNEQTGVRTNGALIYADRLTHKPAFVSTLSVGALPETFVLYPAHPNPFNPVTNITYDIAQNSEVTLEIYNVMGQRVRTLAQGSHEPGRYRVMWNATNDYGQSLSSGMYIYRIQAGDFVSVKKLILMK